MKRQPMTHVDGRPSPERRNQAFVREDGIRRDRDGREEWGRFVVVAADLLESYGGLSSC